MQNSQVYVPVGTSQIVNDSNTFSAYLNAQRNETDLGECHTLNGIKDRQIYNLTKTQDTLTEEKKTLTKLVHDLQQQLARALNQDPSTIIATEQKSSSCTIS